MLTKLIGLTALSAVITIAILAGVGWQSFAANTVISEMCSPAQQREEYLGFLERGTRVGLVARNENTTLSAIWFETPGAPKAVVMTHGLDECLTDSRFIAAARHFQDAGFSVFMVEMRNHGQSQRTNGLHGFGSKAALDLLGAWDWVIDQGYRADQVVLYGQSLGGSAVLYATIYEPRIAASVADSPITRVDWAFLDGGAPAFMVPILKSVGTLRGFDIWTNPAEAFFAKTDQRILVLHSIDDQVTNVKHARYLATHLTAPSRRSVVEISQSAHVATARDFPEQFRNIVLPFVSQ